MLKITLLSLNVIRQVFRGCLLRKWNVGPEVVIALFFLYYILFFLTMLFVANIATRLPALVGISLTMLALSLVLHTVAVRRLLLAQATPSSHQPGIVK